ncbi:MAG: hypothetical protein ACE5F7_08225 [Nitrospiria bacterium]
MKKFALLLIMSLMVLTFSAVGFAGGDHPGGHGKKTVGEVVKAQGSFVTVKDEHGKSHKFHVDKSTHLKGKIKSGTKVEVESTDRGHAISMTAKE